MGIKCPQNREACIMEPLNKNALLHLIQYFRRLDWDKAIDGVSQPEYLVLSVVHQEHEKHPDLPGIYVSHLADGMMISVSMASKLLKIMEEKEWILRTIDKNSRRNTFVSLTEDGRKMLEKADRSIDEVNQAVAEKMGKESLQQLIDNLALLFSCYEDVLGTL